MKTSMKTIIVNGPPASGKTAFIGLCRKWARGQGFHNGNISSVDAVKAAALLLGWDGEKNEKGRRFLHHLKNVATMEYNGPMQAMQSAINKFRGYPKVVLFFDIREPQEINRFRVEYPETLTVLIHRGHDGSHHENTSDSTTFNYPYDYTIHNNQGLAELEINAVTFMEKLYAENR